jgi:hypothetical protein
VKLTALTPEQVYASWGWIRNGLLTVISKGRREEYLPEDVYVRLRGGTAWAYTFGEDEFGFVILTQEFDPDGLALFVWAIWLEPGSGKGCEGELYAALEDLARAARAKRIRMHSSRKGWEGRGFFEQVAVVYEHEVNHG